MFIESISDDWRCLLCSGVCSLTLAGLCHTDSTDGTDFRLTALAGSSSEDINPPRNNLFSSDSTFIFIHSPAEARLCDNEGLIVRLI